MDVAGADEDRVGLVYVLRGGIAVAQLGDAVLRDVLGYVVENAYVAHDDSFLRMPDGVWGAGRVAGYRDRASAAWAASNSPMYEMRALTASSETAL